MTLEESLFALFVMPVSKMLKIIRMHIIASGFGMLFHY